MLCMFPTCFVTLKCESKRTFTFSWLSMLEVPLLPMKRGSALCFPAVGTRQSVSVENPGEADSGMVYNDPHNV